MTYQEALKEAKRVGAARSEGLPLLAQTCQAMSYVHAVNPEMLYNGAKKKGYSAKQLIDLPQKNMSDFAFLSFV